MISKIANVIWFIFSGIWLFLIWSILGIILCITVVGIPLGIQCFKAAKLSALPFGKKVILNVGEHPVANTVWALLLGWEIALAYLLSGIIHCITIIGIPNGIRCFKFMKLAFFPFGAIISKGDKHKKQ